MRSSIRRRLFALTAVLLVLAMLLGFNAYRIAESAREGLGAVLSTGNVLRNHVEADMMHDALRADALMALRADTADAWTSAESDFRSHAEWFRRVLDNNRKETTDEHLQKALAQVAPALDSYIDSVSQLVETAHTDRAKAESMLPKVLSAFSALEGQMESLSDIISKSAEATQTKQIEELAAAVHWCLGLLALALIIGITAALTTTRSVNRSVTALHSTLERVRSSRNLSVRASTDGLSEIADLASGFNEMIAQLQEVITEVTRSTDDITAGAREVNASSRSLADGAREQSIRLQRINSALTKLSAQAEHNSSVTTQASSLSTESKQATARVEAELQNLSAAMGEIKTASHEVANVNRVIDEIAFQINLLALNAAVEAARAGEAGRGFAVVAEEVRNLAQRSAKAARETATLIDAATDRADRGAEIAKRVHDALADIARVTTNVNGLLVDIAGSVSEQTREVHEIHDHVQSLERVSDQAAGGAQKLAGISTQTSAQISVLGQVAGRFVARRAA